MKKITCILAIAAGLAILGFVLYCAGIIILISAGVIDPPFGKSYIDNMDDPEFQRMVEGQINVVFPETVQWRKSYYNGWLEMHFCCKFRIPEEEIEPMVARHKGEWHDNDRSTLPSGYHLDWMNMEQLSNFRVFESVTPGHSFYVVLDRDSRDDEGKLTVYMEFYDH